MTLGDGQFDWASAGDAQLDDVVTLRRAIHAEPEVGLHCPMTTAKAKAALAGLPLEIHDSRSTTGFVA
ncbi:MAG TPA: amidohydrolase, partial [Sphingomonas sp.]